MKELNCDVIKDLLPGYIDKTTSENTNNLVREHLLKCKNCSATFDDMNNDFDSNLFNHNEQIDFLKGFRKDKIVSIVKAILIMIIIFLILFLFLQEVVRRFEFSVDINKLFISYSSKESFNENTSELVFSALDKNFNLQFEYEKTDNGKNIYIKPVGTFTYFCSPNRSYFFVDIDKNTESAFLKDKNGNIKEIWNKYNGVLIDERPYIIN